MFMAVGGAGVIHHFSQPNFGGLDQLWLAAVRALPAWAGMMLLRGRNWSRWLLAAWLGGHVMLGLHHGFFKFAAHGLLFAAVVFCLFRKTSASFFSLPPPAPSTKRSPHGAEC